jgi:hypothetical protein
LDQETSGNSGIHTYRALVLKTRLTFCIFFEKKVEKIGDFDSNYYYIFRQKKLSELCFFKKNAIFAENWRKYLKIGMLTLAPG